MLYAVSARLVSKRARELHTRLTEGSIAAQRPDGTVRWTETCFCPTPLRHERETVLDRYFTDIETELIDEPVAFDGEPLRDRLETS